MKEYFCCGLHHSSYCPECRGELCENRIKYGLSPEGWNEELIEKINDEIQRQDSEVIE